MRSGCLMRRCGRACRMPAPVTDPDELVRRQARHGRHVVGAAESYYRVTCWSVFAKRQPATHRASGHVGVDADPPRGRSASHHSSDRKRHNQSTSPSNGRSRRPSFRLQSPPSRRSQTALRRRFCGTCSWRRLSNGEEVFLPCTPPNCAKAGGNEVAFLTLRRENVFMSP
jgi:hypothetical protein